MKHLINLQKPSTKKRWLIKKDKKTGKIIEVLLPYMPDKNLKKQMLTDKQFLIEYEKQKQ